MISLTPIIQALTQKPAGFDGLWFRTVEGAAEYARRRLESLPLPACWIVREADKVRHAGAFAEDTTFGFDVVIAISNARSHAAGDTDDLLLTYRQAIKTRLLGWEIPEAPVAAGQGGVNQAIPNPIKYLGGQVIEYSEGDLYWRDRYEFDALITNYLADPTTPFNNSDLMERNDGHYL